MNAGPKENKNIDEEMMKKKFLFTSSEIFTQD
jgi:hypothetical protein